MHKLIILSILFLSVSTFSQELIGPKTSIEITHDGLNVDGGQVIWGWFGIYIYEHDNDPAGSVLRYKLPAGESFTGPKTFTVKWLDVLGDDLPTDKIALFVRATTSLGVESGPTPGIMCVWNDSVPTVPTKISFTTEIQGIMEAVIILNPDSQ